MDERLIFSGAFSTMKEVGVMNIVKGSLIFLN